MVLGWIECRNNAFQNIPMFSKLILISIFIFGFSTAQIRAQSDQEVIEFQEMSVQDIEDLKKHNSPLPENGNWWIKINGERLRNKRVTIYLWKGNPPKRSAMSGRVGDDGVWRWRQRGANRGYAPFDLSNGDKIHIICRNGEEINRCYQIEEVRTNTEGIVNYFRGRQVPCN